MQALSSSSSSSQSQWATGLFWNVYVFESLIWLHTADRLGYSEVYLLKVKDVENTKNISLFPSQ